VTVGKVPVLGSGKIDFVTARAMALESISESQAA
jgi:acyl-[acyl-carrier-protein]-phospholipid O-acyltransferase/long-chain-fatty-acid--[acyl-carrier-protein] ligase